MGARFYDSVLGRWLSADALVPDPSDPQSFNKFSYVEGNPIKLIDPSGHVPRPVICHDGSRVTSNSELRQNLQTDYGVSVQGSWARGELIALSMALSDAERTYKRLNGNSPVSFKAAAMAADAHPGELTIARGAGGSDIDLGNNYISYSGSLEEEFDGRYGGGEYGELGLGGIHMQDKRRLVAGHELMHLIGDADDGNIHENWIEGVGGELGYVRMGVFSTLPNTIVHKEASVMINDYTADVFRTTARGSYFWKSSELSAEFLSWLALNPEYAALFAEGLEIDGISYVQSLIDGSQ
jgi:hypothetical protein